MQHGARRSRGSPIASVACPMRLHNVPIENTQEIYYTYGSTGQGEGGTRHVRGEDAPSSQSLLRLRCFGVNPERSAPPLPLCLGRGIAQRLRSRAQFSYFQRQGRSGSAKLSAPRGNLGTCPVDRRQGNSQQPSTSCPLVLKSPKVNKVQGGKPQAQL